eukprot:CAMPEP_0168472920 /NCGR_PEP_ID=MMETSP0228-20121227/60051_1 /TAXON_ID=133427 /ORGANISM="Protoceratium reticulatum, Strain CCCM 535 (=CCMP 1889)" /LENGTH=31 /DNA_ID= /DNA_START= /DNA_END= /DNA_ORIENTATION=
MTGMLKQSFLHFNPQGERRGFSPSDSPQHPR